MARNKLRAGIIVSYLAAGISTLVSMVYTPFMLRMLGQSEYGVYQLVYSVAGYLNLLSFGFGSAYIRFYSRYTGADRESRVASLNGMYMTIFGVLSMVCCAVGFALVPNVDTLFRNLTDNEARTAKILLFFLVINVALTFPNSVLDSYVTAHEEFVFQKLLYLLKTVCNPLLAIPFLLLGMKSVALVVITTVLTALTLGINLVFCRKKLGMRFFFRKFDFGLFRELAVFSSFIFLNVVTDQVNWNVSKFLLGIFRGSGEIAIYGVASQLNTYYMDCAILVSAVFIPKVNKIVASGVSGRQLNDLFIRVGRIQFMILMLVCSGFVFFGRQFLPLWAGEGYEQAYPIAIALMLAVTVPMTQNIGIEIQKARNMHKFRSLLYFAMAIGNLLLGLLLTPRIGMLGCVVGTVSGLVIGNTLLMNLYYWKKIGLDIKAFWKNIGSLLPALALPGAVGVGYTMLPNQSVYTMVAGIGVYTAVYLLSLYFVGMNPQERDLIRRPVGGVLRRLRRKKHD